MYSSFNTIHSLLNNLSGIQQIVWNKSKEVVNIGTLCGRFKK